MADVITVLHPAPVRFIPNRGRLQRLSFDIVGTPVSVREISGDEMRHVGRIGPGDPRLARGIHEHDGLLWTPLLDERKAPIAASDMSAFLEGGYDGWRRTDIPKAMGRTPVILARDPVRGEDLEWRGSVRPPGGHVVHDGTSRARSDLVSYLDGNLRYAGGTAYVRVPGLLAYRSYQYHDRPVYCATPSPRGFSDLAILTRADAVVEHWEHRLSAHERESGGGKVLPEVVGVEGLSGHVPDDSDILLAANLAAGEAMRIATRLAGDDKDMREALSSHAAGLDGYGTLAALGAVRPEETEDLFTKVMVLLDHVGATSDPKDHTAERAARMGAFVRNMILPRLSSPVLGADADALLGMAL